MPTKKTPAPRPASPARLKFSLAPEIKARVARAAALTGQALTDFAVAALSEKAEEILARHEQLTLSPADYEFFLQALSEVPEPSARSQQAAARYRQGKRHGVRYQRAN